MELSRTIQERRSITKFKLDCVPIATIQEILTAAQRSPLTINTQPWEYWVAGCETVEQMEKELYQAGKNGEAFRHDFHVPGEWKEVYLKRMHENGKRLFAMLGIDRQDRKGKKAIALSMYKPYNAPPDHLRLP